MLQHPLQGWTKGPHFPKGQRQGLLCAAHFFKCPALGAQELISVLGTAWLLQASFGPALY